MILNLPNNGKDVWLECTNQEVPFGFLGSFTDDRNVLVVNENGGKIDKTTAYKPKDNYQSIVSSITVSEAGDINGQVQITSFGTQFGNKYPL